ncbi:MAG: DEAD/DEAH box helicase family protein, partial [Candidatus Methanomethylophilaceae archaeon]|nr:DEAD/DEAH box helicase family protein [Candidatus Methanomethylophilaceae archaeon]
MPPGCSRCRNCGAYIDGDSVSSQTSLFGGSFEKKKEPVIKTVEGAPFMPYEPRGCQMAIIEDVRNALDDGRHIVMESGTGTGKTIVSLASALEHASKTGKKVIYLTRTISQSDQVMKELKAINGIRNVSGIAVTGRNKSCPLYRGNPGFENLSPNVLSMMCEERKQRSIKGKAGGCRYFDKVKNLTEEVKNYCFSEFPTSEILDRHCEKMGACPYEMKKILMRSADVVAVPYVHILSEDIRNNLLANVNAAEPERIVLIIDEAHNFTDAAKDAESFTISIATVDAAIDECESAGNPNILPGTGISEFIKYFKTSMRGIATEKMGLGQREYVFDDDYIEKRLMEKFSLGPQDLVTAVQTVAEIGEERSARLIEAGGDHISPLESLGKSMVDWCTANSRRYIRTMKIDQNGEYLSAACIDPAEISYFLRKIPG